MQEFKQQVLYSWLFRWCNPQLNSWDWLNWFLGELTYKKRKEKIGSLVNLSICKSYYCHQLMCVNVIPALFVGFSYFSPLFRWFAKRFLHPDVVSIYDYIFLWDEDLGVDHFNPERYTIWACRAFFEVVCLCNSSVV